MNRESFFSEVLSYKITNPLATAVIIGDYSDSRLPSIKTANKDYQNIIDSFHDTYGYTVVVAQNDKNGEDYTLACFSSSGDHDAPQIQSCNFKCKWTEEKIEDFNEKIKEDFIDNDSINFDSLIYIISCHGDGKSAIYDSRGENVFLSNIYCEFDNRECRNLRNKPKIYLLDTYRVGGGNNNSSIRKSNTDNNNQQEEKQVDASASDVVVTKNNLKNVTIPAAATYTTDTHFREVFGNSGHQPISNVNETIGHSIFIQCLTQIIKRNPSVNLCDILVKTRSSMSAMLKLDENSDVNAIVLSDVSTMPYKVNFGQQTVCIIYACMVSACL